MTAMSAKLTRTVCWGITCDDHQNDGVAMLAALLSAPGCDVRSAAMGALMVITTVDAGKNPAESVAYSNMRVLPMKH